MNMKLNNNSKHQKISVLMSVYNEQENLSNSIKSILNQTYDNFEFLILDDCSDDESFEIIKKFKQKDKRIKSFKNSTNLGLTKSLNKLIDETSGTLIARQDADDFSFQNRFESQIKFINKKKLDGCTTKALIKNSISYIPNKSFYINKKLIMKLKNPFVHGSLMIKKINLQKIGGYNEKFYYAQDYKLMADLIREGSKIKILNEIQYVLNTKENISTKFSKEQAYYAGLVKKNLEV